MARLIRDRYELLDTLGAGGEARVVKALDLQHGRFVALKIRPVWDGGTRESLLNEARILLAVPPHPALPLVREDFFDGDVYIVAMDWVDGTDLARLLRDRGRPGLAPSSVLAYLSDAAQALTHLHAQDPPVIHGDVKPGNLILTKGGRIKLVDFGLSSAPGALRRRAGTPGFRAPELSAEGPPSRASDVFALAASAFALLTGSPPAGTLPTWTGIDPDQAEQFEAALRLGLATDPSRRPATPGELVERLRAGWAAALPAGVITFCVSDIEGSSAMWETEPAAMAEALVRHDEVIADCVAAHRGRLVKSMGEGDSTVSVFDSAASAVKAALAAIRALADEPWPGDLRVAVRFALHTGESERRGTVYYGPSINLAARLRSQADGGQVFVSAVTADLVRHHLPDGYELIDLGVHRLDGLAAPERIHALKGPGVRTPAAATECPYRGLLAFQPEDRSYFFGRERVVAELIARLGPGRLLAVVGASGSGKSSVLRAGVTAAALAGELPGIHDARVLTPGSDPPVDLPGPADQLLVVDQLEELFTQCPDPERRQAFVNALLAASGPVAVGVRADMYGQLAVHPDLARAVAGNQLLLGAMSEAELERVVREPARLAGLRLEPGLVELAVREVAGEPGALPLLSHALRATWGRRDGRTLTVERYRDSGGVSAALAQTADDVVGSLPAEQRQLARSVFVRLTELGEGIAETRRRVAIDELVPAGVARATVQELLERLADARLVTLGEGTAEVAHEVLIREWPALRGWLDEDREGLRLHRRLGDAARLWEAGGREPSDLYRGSRLSAAADWAASHLDQLNAGERAFLDAGSAAADGERRAQLRTNRRLRGLLAGTGLLLVVAVIAGVFAVVQRDHARAQALTSDAERLGAQALTEQDVDRQLLLAVAAVKLQDRAETRSDLLAVLQKNSALIRFSRPVNDLLLGVQVSPDGRQFAVGDAAGRVLFMNAATWQPIGRAVELGDPLAPRAMSFSPDGRTLMAVTVGSSRASLWAIDTASHRARLVRRWAGLPPFPPNGSDGVAYSPDGRTLAVSLVDEPAAAATPTAERLVLLDAASGQLLWQRRYPMRAGQAEPHVAFTPGGKLLTSAQQGDTLLWNVHSGRVTRRFPVGGLPAISVDGREVALGMNSPEESPGSSSAVAVLDLRTGQARTLAANLPSAWIRGIFFTPDGRRIVADAFDGVHVWNVATGTITESFVGQPGQRSVMGMDPAGTTAIVGSQDGSVAAFDVSGTRRLGRTFTWADTSLVCTSGEQCDAVNSQSDLLADVQGTGAIALVDLRTLRLDRTLPPRDGPTANALSFLPDGRTVVNGGPSGRVTFWDVSTGRIVRELHLGAPVLWTAPSPDGTVLAVQTQAANSSRSQIDLVRIATGQVLQRHTLHNAGPTSGGLVFSPDGRELVTLGCCSATPSVVAWDTRTGRQLYRLTPPGTAGAIAISSRLLGVGMEDGRVLLLHPRTGETAEPPLQAAAGNIASVSFSPDGREVAVGAGDNSVSLWDLRARERIGNPFGPDPGLFPLALFQPNGQLLVVLQESAVQWPTDVQSWERFACRAAGRDLTPTEWRDLLPDRSYRPVCAG